MVLLYAQHLRALQNCFRHGASTQFSRDQHHDNFAVSSRHSSTAGPIAASGALMAWAAFAHFALSISHHHSAPPAINQPAVNGQQRPTTSLCQQPKSQAPCEHLVWALAQNFPGMLRLSRHSLFAVYFKLVPADITRAGRHVCRL
jgi:hypothetical protein